jgi:Tfp pilus assembly protein PilV
MTTKTAVEWLFNKLWDTNHITQYTTQGVDSFELLEQAKAMEKEQMTSFAKLWEEKLLDGRIDSVDHLYNEIYGK